MARLGFGVAGALEETIIARLAEEAERRGFSTFWVNDTPAGDGLAAIKAAARATASMRLGVGVIPVDRRPVNEILGTISELRLPEDRLLLGIASGRARQGSLDLVEAAIEQLRAESGLQIAVGALGPKMVRLGAQKADAVLLNWLTPAQAAASHADIEAIAQSEKRNVETIGYVRAALPSAEAQLREEADRYASVPQYAAHFKRMGVEAIETCAFGSEADIREHLEAFSSALDETVVRAIVKDESVAAYLELLEAVAPRG